MSQTDNYKLYMRAQDSREPLLGEAEILTLHARAIEAATAGNYGDAFNSVESLLCQASRGVTVPALSIADILAALLGHGYTAEVIQGLADRLESLEHYGQYPARRAV